MRCLRVCQQGLKSTAICYYCCDRESVFSALAGQTAKTAHADAPHLLPSSPQNASTLRASGRPALTGASAHAAVFSEALLSERDNIAHGALGEMLSLNAQ